MGTTGAGGRTFVVEVSDPDVDCGLVAPGHRVDPAAARDWQSEALRPDGAVWFDALRIEGGVVVLGRGRRTRRRHTHTPDLLAFTWVTSRGEALLLPRRGLLVVFGDEAAHLFGLSATPVVACTPVVASTERRVLLRAARDRPVRWPSRIARPVAPEVPRWARADGDGDASED